MPSRPSRTTRPAPDAAPGGVDSVERLIRLRQEAERIVAELFRQTERTAGVGPTPEGPRVPLDLYERDDEFLLCMDVPGVQRKDLSLSVVGSTLIVEGRKRAEMEAGPEGGRVAYECAERVYGAFRRVIELPGAADSSRIQAQLERGVLAVRLPRIRDRRNRRREVAIG